MTIGEKIQQLRKQNGLSQEQLANELNVSRQAISKWELNDSVPELDKIVSLSKIFSVSIDDLLSNETNHSSINSNNRYSDADVFSKIVRMIKTKGYRTGYLLIGWGLIALIMIAFVGFSWFRMMNPFGTVESIFQLPVDMLTPFYFIGFIGVIAIAVAITGIVIVIRGKKK
ncbi:helix-turn-helix domain-containing protein [Lutispora saccharofermentans]|uniref:Helix-turn-helix domain-containing protein n=1 Tax=Lutispora saccharofermentans TaxID=3024236 RepID=A0ABT1NIW8_9FIRM|nr:helix-turn-helix transcriptional regulator [Lutispora saccharofermentans]MCQ1531179.1 helix-turn-helix domain-containing protein [Lutispora saccharofermentans]